jgi:hypothetical protein
VTWFARGYGALKSGDASEPPRALTQLKALEQRASAAGETIFARQIQVLGWNLEGWMAHAANDDALAVNLLRQSAELEASTPKPAVTPAPTLPAPELLGDDSTARWVSPVRWLRRVTNRVRRRCIVSFSLSDATARAPTRWTTCGRSRKGRRLVPNDDSVRLGHGRSHGPSVFRQRQP